MFYKFGFSPHFQLFAKFLFFFFAENLAENLDEVCSSCDIYFFKDSDDEPSSIYESSDESLSLSLGVKYATTTENLRDGVLERCRV